MQGDPAQFETIGSRLGFEVAEERPGYLRLTWQGPRFPAFLCLGLALALLFISIPIVQAIQLRGFTGAAGSLWYFPLMNVILFVIALYLVTQRRSIEIDSAQKRVTLRRRSLLRVHHLEIGFDEIAKLAEGMDQVESGFALAGSTAAQTYPVPSLRIIHRDGTSILLDRASKRRIEALVGRVGHKLGEIASHLG
ncbi:MAG: hypothetical protein FJ145_18285 [Deltaproteobacteria bacterium]|nr:hypothetical protein [Deltaproteobacteria bacterium]